MIKAGTSEDVRALIAALGADDDGRREVAVARLIISGSGALTRLVATYDTVTDRRTQLAILRVLEAVDAERGMPIARRALGAGGDVAIGGVAVLRELIAHGSGSTHAEALDLLLSAASDPAIERRVRSAAAQALRTAPDDIRDIVSAGLRDAPSPEDALWDDAAEGRLPDDPESLRESVAARAGTAPLALLRRLVESVRARESEVPPGSRRDAWRTVRGALHQAAALRGSRIALYDLRETIEISAEPLPPSFLAAVQLVGEASCLEPLATAWSRAPADQPRWRHQLAQAFHAVVTRERLTRKHSAMRRALAKAPELAR
jgi:hypothetical protein